MRNVGLIHMMVSATPDGTRRNGFIQNDQTGEIIMDATITGDDQALLAMALETFKRAGMTGTLKRYRNHVPLFPGAVYAHDCTHCTFMKSENGADWYVCRDPQDPTHASVIKRTGSAGPDYSSLPMSMLGKLPDNAIMIGFDPDFMKDARAMAARSLGLG